jgi:uncharacterized protein YkwD
MTSYFSFRFFIVACLISITTLLSWSPKQSSLHKSLRSYRSQSNTEKDILFYVNDYRSRKGLPALEMNVDIAAQAEKHSVDMATNKVGFGHDGFEDRVKIISKKIGNIHSSAENVAYGNLSPKEVVDIWLRSPGHRKNIEGKYTLTGIGIATGKDNIIFFTEIFTSK